MKNKKVDDFDLDKLLQKVQDQIERGDITSIHDKIGLSKATVSNHILGKTKRPSLLILEVAIQIINERKKLLNEKTRQLAESLNG
jgi:hypothetical protein